MGRPWDGPTLLCVGGLPRRGRPTKKPLSNHRRPAGWKPDIKRTHEATWPKPLGKPATIIRVRRTGMVLPLPFLLLVFFTYDLNQPRAATSPFRRGTRSDASCTVQEFPIQRQKPELRCQEQLSVFIKKDLRVMARQLFVIPTPNHHAFAGNSRNGRGLIQVSILLALVIEGNINICHQRATGLHGCVQFWWKPPPQPMMTCLVRKTVLR